MVVEVEVEMVRWWTARGSSRRPRGSEVCSTDGKASSPYREPGDDEHEGDALGFSRAKVGPDLRQLGGAPCRDAREAQEEGRDVAVAAHAVAEVHRGPVPAATRGALHGRRACRHHAYLTPTCAVKSVSDDVFWGGFNLFASGRAP